MRFDWTITPATVIALITLLVASVGGMKFYYKVLIIMGEYPPHRHTSEEGITYPKGMTPDKRR